MADAAVDLTGLVGVVREYRARAVDLEPVMHAIAEGFVAAVADNFESAGHGKWPPLATSTLKARRGSTGQILKDTGRLAGSVQAYATADTAEAATDVSYAIFHVSEAPRTKLPRRDFLELTKEQFETEPAEMIAAYIANGGIA